MKDQIMKERKRRREKGDLEVIIVIVAAVVVALPHHLHLLPLLVVVHQKRNLVNLKHLHLIVVMRKCLENIHLVVKRKEVEVEVKIIEILRLYQLKFI